MGKFPTTEDRIPEIDQIRHDGESQLLSYPNVVGTATGFKIKSDKITIIVFVEKKLHEPKLGVEICPIVRPRVPTQRWSIDRIIRSIIDRLF